MSRKRVLRKLMEEWLLLASAISLLITSIYLRRIPSYSTDDFRVLYILFVFLIIVRGLEESGFLTGLARVFEASGSAVFKLVCLTAMLSVFVTNDIALIVVVPLTLSLEIERKGTAVIMETLVANAASSISPFGNPQNIFIYYTYGISPMDFILAIAPFSIISTALIVLISYLTFRGKIASTGEFRGLNRSSHFYLLSFLLFAMSMLRFLPLWIGIIPLIYALLIDRNSLKIDYLLLATFFVFFGLTDNISKIFSIGGGNVFLYSALSSQLISNVPSALLYADFTGNWRALLWGVSVGGFGTMIASMANLIAYRFYRTGLGNEWKFLLRFHIWSFSLFFLGIILYFTIS